MTSPPAGRLGPSGLADQSHLTGTRAHQRERALIRYRRANGTSASAFRWLFEVIGRLPVPARHGLLAGGSGIRTVGPPWNGNALRDCPVRPLRPSPSQRKKRWPTPRIEPAVAMIRAEASRVAQARNSASQ